MKKKLVLFLLVFSLIVLAVSFLSFSYSRKHTQNNTRNTSSILPTSQPSSTTDTVNIYLVALEDNGKTGDKIGCGDSIVSVQRKIISTTTPMKDAYEELLSIKTQYYGDSGLYNALYQSKLDIQDISIDASGNAKVQLMGTYALGGVCDSPRFQAQLEKTALQFPNVKTVQVLINGKSLSDIVSEKGE